LAHLFLRLHRQNCDWRRKLPRGRDRTDYELSADVRGCGQGIHRSRIRTKPKCQNSPTRHGWPLGPVLKPFVLMRRSDSRQVELNHRSWEMLTLSHSFIDFLALDFRSKRSRHGLLSVLRSSAACMRRGAIVVLSTRPRKALCAQRSMISSKKSRQRALLERRRDRHDRCSDRQPPPMENGVAQGGKAIRSRADGISSSSPTPSKQWRPPGQFATRTDQ
jgi:hypothetical protein